MNVSGMAPTDDERPIKTLRVGEIAKSSAGRFMCRMNTKTIKELDLYLLSHIGK